MEPPHSYLREPFASVLHHADYLNGGDDQALCGAVIANPTALADPDTADALCPDCEAKLVVYHLEWWRGKAQAANSELEELRAQYRELQQRAGITPPASPAQVDEPRSAQAAHDEAGAEPSTYLDRARRELTELCRQFEGAVPFYRLKNAMQDFSDRLDDDERLLLANEVGPDSSLIRWATTEVESLGTGVTNNRVQENSDMMWQEWLEESQQAPAKTKRRFGRSR